MTEKNKFYYKGSFFNSFEEMIEYEKIWNNEKLSNETFNILFQMFHHDLWLNINYLELTNKDASIALSCSLFDMIKNFRDLSKLYKNSECPTDTCEGKHDLKMLNSDPRYIADE